MQMNPSNGLGFHSNEVERPDRPSYSAAPEPQEIDQRGKPPTEKGLRSRLRFLCILARSLVKVYVTEDVAFRGRALYLTDTVNRRGDVDALRRDIDRMESLILELRDYAPRKSFLGVLTTATLEANWHV